MAAFSLVLVVLAGVSASDVTVRVDDSKRLSTSEPTVGVRLVHRTLEEPGPWELWVALATDFRPRTRSGGGTGRIALSRKVGRIFRPGSKHALNVVASIGAGF